MPDPVGSNNDKEARRRKRLQQELDEESVDLIGVANPLPGGFDKRERLSAALLDELLFARLTPVHEGRRAPYGCVIASSWSWLKQKLKAAELEIVSLDVDESAADAVRRARLLANGRTVFVFRSANGVERLLHLQLATEFALVRFVEETGCSIVQRDATGAIKIFSGDRLTSQFLDSWSLKPFASSRTFELIHILGLTDSSFEVASALLDFCLHFLSARHIGATLVWWPNGSKNENSASETVPPVDIQIREAFDQEVFASLLAVIDGACFINQEGIVGGIEVHLNASDLAREMVPRVGGTRHSSAKYFSFDQPESVCFVVSQDGPVTVFSDGLGILELRALGTYAASLSKMVPEKAEHIDANFTRVTCPRCKKDLTVEVTVILGWKERETVDCPICGHPDVFSAMCFSIRALPLKPWDSEARAITWGLI